MIKKKLKPRFNEYYIHTIEYSPTGHIYRIWI